MQHNIDVVHFYYNTTNAIRRGTKNCRVCLVHYNHKLLIKNVGKIYLKKKLNLPKWCMACSDLLRSCLSFFKFYCTEHVACATKLAKME